MIAKYVLTMIVTDEEQVRGHTDKGDDFFGWFLGPRMTYTSGIISNVHREETLEELRDNKMAIVCAKLDLKQGESLVDMGCGWEPSPSIPLSTIVPK